MTETLKKRERSRLYPRYHLEHAVEFARQIHDLGGSGISKEAVAGKIGKATNNSTFVGRISSAKQFDLVTLESGNLSVTERAERIFLPKSEEDKSQALLEAFSSPPFYGDLISHYRGKTIPDKDSLANLLVHDFQIKHAARHTAAANFLHSAKYIGAIDNGILVLHQTNVQGEDQATADTESLKENKKNPDSTNSNNPTVANGYRELNIAGVLIHIPDTDAFTEALLDGEFKEAKKHIKDFAEKFGD